MYNSVIWGHIYLYVDICVITSKLRSMTTLTQKFSLCPFTVSIQPLVVMAVEALITVDYICPFLNLI